MRDNYRYIKEAADWFVVTEFALVVAAIDELFDGRSSEEDTITPSRNSLLLTDWKKQI